MDEREEYHHKSTKGAPEQEIDYKRCDPACLFFRFPCVKEALVPEVRVAPQTLLQRLAYRRQTLEEKQKRDREYDEQLQGARKKVAEKTLMRKTHIGRPR